MTRDERLVLFAQEAGRLATVADKLVEKNKPFATLSEPFLLAEVVALLAHQLVQLAEIIR